MRSFLHKCSKQFEAQILQLIGEFAGSVLENTDYTRVVSKLHFSVCKNSKLGKVYMHITHHSKLTGKTRNSKRVLRDRFWLVERDAWWYFFVIKRLKRMEERTKGETLFWIRSIRKLVDKQIISNYILCPDRKMVFSSSDVIVV